MRFIGDFHIHSPYSRATSKDLAPENLDLWGRIKGIKVIGTGDFSHPGWVALLRERFEPAEEGLFVLKKGYRKSAEAEGFPLFEEAEPVRFILTAEISSIYKYGGRTRKVHNVIFAPAFETALRIQERIERIGGNIRSDGRPILGLDSRDLLELCLEADDRIFFVPAHIWTPWFSALGSKSGFDSIRECYRDLSGHIRAVETGLSSDPPMNWMCSFLDEYTLISNSDAHSADKLGREANLFDTGLSYPEIVAAMSGPGTDQSGASGSGDHGVSREAGRMRRGFLGTIEFFPQEGKYHFDGHRNCGIVWDPLQTIEHSGICPVCGKPVTVGVLNRVAQLADRHDIGERPIRDPFRSLIPLKEVIAEIVGTGSGSKKVLERYTDCLNRLGTELEILLDRDLRDIERAAGPELAEAIGRMRDRRVCAEPGYDGEFGRIRIRGGERAGSAESRDIGGRRPGELSLYEDSRPGTGVMGDPDLAPAAAWGGGRETESLPLVDFDVAAFQDRRAALGLYQDAAARTTAPGDGGEAAARTTAPGDGGEVAARLQGNGTVSYPRGESGQGALFETIKEEPPTNTSGELSWPTSRGDRSGPRPETGGNAEQEAAAAFQGGHSLIIAGPGTGKTKTIVMKIGKLRESGVAPGRILTLTFANKAAREIAERIAAIGLGDSPQYDPDNDPDNDKTIDPARERGPLVHTFHSLGLSLLRSRLSMIGRSERFFIIDDDEKILLLKEAGVSSAGDRGNVIAMAGKIKNGILPVPAEGTPDFDAFRKYQEILKRNDLFDYDDLVYLPVRIFQTAPGILDEVRKGIRYLIIDEFQDINPIQYELIRLLAGLGFNDAGRGSENVGAEGYTGARTAGSAAAAAAAEAGSVVDGCAEVCAVGDPDQSIYRFRGASPEFIDRFRRDFPDVRVFSLSRSYRCTETVLNASAQVINRGGEALSGLRRGVRITVMKNPTASYEAEQIARDIEKRTGGVGLFSFDSGISGGRTDGSGGADRHDRYDQPGQPDTEEPAALSDIAILCRTGLQIPPLEKALKDHRIPYRTIRTESIFDSEPYRSFLRFCSSVLRKETEPRAGVSGTLEETLDLYRASRRRGTSAGKGGTPAGGDGKDGGSDPMARELVRYWPPGSVLGDFLANARLASGVDRYDPRLQGVTVMTIHAAKGLEFDVVYVPGCEEGILPCTLTGVDDVDLEEEKRLLYVAMTRARNDLLLSWAEKRTLFGRTTVQAQSPFLRAIEESLLSRRDPVIRPVRNEKDDQLPLFE